eukprot:TRINITY_DN12438_c2_g6_i2.p2 TRINITY_DN12438_c2_g6~~TRINITY_DN12438_c2_g6_i2.p2  ORF type:complete len:346 (+),score=68.56 TRINITY_DN12438_c2_g6_i2:268-1305(+)
MASSARDPHAIQSWLRVYGGDANGGSKDLLGIRRSTNWSVKLVTFDPSQMKLYIHDNEDARASDQDSFTNYRASSWIGASEAPKIAPLADDGKRSQRPSQPRLLQRFRTSKSGGSLSTIPNAIDLQGAEAYRTHRSLFEYAEGFRFVFAVSTVANPRYLFKCRDRATLNQWLAAIRNAVCHNDRAQYTMQRELILDIESFRRSNKRGNTRTVAVYGVILIKGRPEAVTRTYHLLDTIDVKESFVFDWRALSDEDLNSEISLQVYLEPRAARDKLKVVSEGILACSGMSSGNAGQTKRTVCLEKTDKLKQMNVVINARHQLIIILPAAQLEPLVDWWRSDGIHHFR